MKHTLSLLIAASVFLASCSQQGGDDLASKKEQLKTYKTELQELKAKIEKTEKEIAQLDTNYSKHDKNAVLVTVLQVKPELFTHKFEARGSVASRTNVWISPEASGKIQTVKVKEGQRVSSGQVLAIIDSRVLRNSIAEVKTALELATTMYEKQERLYKQQIGTEVQYLQAKNNKESLERKLATLNAQLDMTVVKAPFSGVIDEVLALVGEMAMAGSPIVRMVNPDNVYIKANVSERFIGTFDTGDQVEVYFPTYTKNVTATISSVGNVISPQDRTFEIEVTLPNVDYHLKPNQVAVLTIEDYKNPEAIVVPTKIIQKDNNGNFVYTIDNGQAKKTYVSLGSSYNERTEVEEGLELKQLVADKGYRELSEGVAVRVKSTDNVNNSNTTAQVVNK